MKTRFQNASDKGRFSEILRKITHNTGLVIGKPTPCINRLRWHFPIIHMARDLIPFIGNRAANCRKGSSERTITMRRFPKQWDFPSSKRSNGTGKPPLYVLVLRGGFNLILVSINCASVSTLAIAIRGLSYRPAMAIGGLSLLLQGLAMAFCFSTWAKR